MTIPRLSPRAAATARALIGVTAVAALVGLAIAAGVMRPVDDGFAALRFALARQPASHQVTVVEIDTPSLRAAKTWPWSRARFAKAVQNLQAAGATVVGFDVDFSARSSPEADRLFQAAIEQWPGQIVLPTFVQSEIGADGARRLVENAPFGPLGAQALLANVNVPVDGDGWVRRYQPGVTTAAGYRQAMGSLLAGAPHGLADSFLLDYGAGEIDRLSFEAVYRNQFDAAKVRGRAILIGATALELGDEFATPAGTRSGVYLHALAAENMLTGRTLRVPSHGLTLVLTVMLAIALRPAKRGVRSLAWRHGAAAAALLVGPVALQMAAPVSLEVGPLVLAQALCLMWAVREELKGRAESIVQAREAGLLRLAMHQPETELPNRRALVGDIAAELARREGLCTAVVTVGIDRYATLRGAIGYGLYNRLIQEVAARLREACPGARVAQLSAADLALVVSQPDREGLNAEIGKLLSLDPSYALDRHALDAFIRLGVAIAADGDGADDLLEHAAIALDDARRLDRRLSVFDAQGFADPSLGLALVSEMRAGLKAGHLAMYYQPKVAAADGRITGLEGLLRWRHPQRGFIPPQVFVAAAEESGAIRELTEWTMARALADSARLRGEGYDLPISVNVSGRLLADSAFCEAVQAMVQGRAHELCLEITETAVIESPSEATEAIAAFRAAGLKISIDDYGVGLSSLSYLKMLDADELKVDKSLVDGIGESERDRLILKSTVDLAHSLGMVVVVEGVETETVRAVAANMGCDTIQGYLVSHALPMDELLAFIAARARAAPRGVAA